MDLDKLLCDADIPYAPHTPDVLPPSIRDVALSPPMEMAQPLQDPCPLCGAWRMEVGDYVCYGACSVCYENAAKEF